MRGSEQVDASLLLLGELPTVVQLIGGAFIVLGVALVRIDELRTPAEASMPEDVSQRPAAGTR